MPIWLLDLSMADVDNGVRSIVLEDYATAFTEFSNLAEEGVPRAQYWLGLMHEFGDGVPQDYSKAKKWYERAAEQGQVGAQLQLAEMYLFGRGTERDYVSAYKWYDIAARRGVRFAAWKRNRIATRGMNRAEINRAKRLARNWRPDLPYAENEDAYAHARELVNERSSFQSLINFFRGD